MGFLKGEGRNKCSYSGDEGGSKGKMGYLPSARKYSVSSNIEKMEISSCSPEPYLCKQN
jgi:hypothetical protein